MAGAAAPFHPGRLGFADIADVDEFVATLERYERGELAPDAWRAFRLVRGVYGQRQPDEQMFRVKIPQGILSASQLETLADVMDRYTNGRAHLTTRQNVQLYGMQLSNAEGAMRTLAEAGITTREACGHSVRNITACQLAGVDPSEVFDVTPYADALTRHLLRGPLSSTLPRKFKLAFEGCHKSCARAAINDLGFIARRGPSGEPGFRVVAGGGTATLSRSAQPLLEFLPAEELCAVAEAVVRVFHRLGNRTNKHKARLKWVIEKLGFAAFQEAVVLEWEAIRAAGGARLPFDPAAPPSEPTPPAPPGLPPSGALDGEAAAAFEAWQRTNVLAQRQAGYCAVTVTLVLGDLDAKALRRLAQLCAAVGDGSVRTTADQNLVLRYVPEAQLRPLYLALREIGLGAGGAALLSDVVSCPGADTCAIAVTASRGVARIVREQLERTPSAWAGTDGARVFVSGCPNGCGQHHIGTFGLQGGLRKIGGRPVPLYHLTIGGGIDDSGARFGRLVGKLPARRAPLAISRLVDLWKAEQGAGESLERFLAALPLARARHALADLFEIDERSATPEDFVDLGQSAPFEVALGESECAQ